MFVWAKLNDQNNAAEIASLAAKEGIMLAPGNMFRPHQESSPWFRFNVAHCDNDALFEFLKMADTTLKCNFQGRAVNLQSM